MLTAESKADQPIRFAVSTIFCSLPDQDGNRWNQPDRDSVGFSWSAVELEPAQRSKAISRLSPKVRPLSRVQLVVPKGSRNMTTHPD
jgi:hypothetical protein